MKRNYESIVAFDNEAITSWQLPVAFLHTFAAIGKSMSGKRRRRRCGEMGFKIFLEKSWILLVLVEIHAFFLSHELFSGNLKCMTSQFDLLLRIVLNNLFIQFFHISVE